MLGICKRYHFILLEPVKSVKNKQKMQIYLIITERTS